MQETTTSSMVPGAHIEVAFSKIGLDATQYLKGGEGFYAVEYPLATSQLSEVLESLYEVRRESPSQQVEDLVSSLIENITTRNDITNEELSVLYSIARGGGTANLVSVVEATPGMSKALGSIKWKGDCQNCGFKVPKYTGRYPKTCPECHSELMFAPGQKKESIELDERDRDLGAFDPGIHSSHKDQYRISMRTGDFLGSPSKYWDGEKWVDDRKLAKVYTSKKRGTDGGKALIQARKAAKKFSQNPDPGTPDTRPYVSSKTNQRRMVGEVQEALKTLTKRVNLARACGLSESAVEKVFPLPQEATPLQRILLGEASQEEVFVNGDLVSHEDIFESLALYLLESEDMQYDRLVGALFEKFPPGEDPNLVTTLRQEVSKRTALAKAISSLRMMDETNSTKSRDYFVLNKALSSCFTRAMIEGESRGGDEFKMIGKCIFEMMQRAFDGDLRGPARFLNTFFLEG